MWDRILWWALERLADRYESPGEAVQAVADRLGVEVYLDRDAALCDAAADVDRWAGVWTDGGTDEEVADVLPDAVLADAQAIQDLDRRDQLEALDELAMALDLPPEAWCVDPLRRIGRLEDDPDAAYVWMLNESADGTDVDELTRRLESAFREQHGHPPRAMHFIVRDVDEVQPIPPEMVEDLIQPWLRNRREDSEADQEDN
jgi:hypothetical protein